MGDCDRRLPNNRDEILIPFLRNHSGGMQVIAYSAILDACLSLALGARVKSAN